MVLFVWVVCVCFHVLLCVCVCLIVRNNMWGGIKNTLLLSLITFGYRQTATANHFLSSLFVIIIIIIFYLLFYS